MAKKTLEIKEPALDDQLEYDPGAKPPRTIMGKGRKAITDSVGGTYDGFFESFTDIGSYKQAMVDALPKDAKFVYESGVRTLDTVSGLYDNFKAQAGPVLGDIATQIDNAIPEKSMLKGLSKSFKNLFIGEQDSGPGQLSESEVLERALSNTFKETFGALESLQTVRQKESDSKRLIESVAEQRQEEIHQLELITALKPIENSLQKLEWFKLNVETKVQRKLVELNFRSYMLAGKQFDHAQKTTLETQDLLRDILKNTSLPDFQKIEKTEMFAEHMSKRTIGALTDSLFKDDSALGGILTNIKKAGNDFISEFVSSLSVAQMAAGMGGQLLGKDATMSIAEMAGRHFGSDMGTKLKEKILEPILKTISEHDGIKRTGLDVSNLLKDPKGLIERMKNSKKYEEYRSTRIPYLGVTGEDAMLFIEDLLRPNRNSNAFGKVAGSENMLAAGPTEKYYTAMIDVVPGYLARILRYTTGIAGHIGVTNEKMPDLVLFDYNTNSWSSSGEIKARIEKTLEEAVTGSSHVRLTTEGAWKVANSLGLPPEMVPEVAKVLSGLANYKGDAGFIQGDLKARENFKDSTAEMKSVMDMITAVKARTEDKGEDGLKAAIQLNEILSRLEAIRRTTSTHASLLTSIAGMSPDVRDILHKELDVISPSGDTAGQFGVKQKTIEARNAAVIESLIQKDLDERRTREDEIEDRAIADGLTPPARTTKRILDSTTVDSDVNKKTLLSGYPVTSDINAKGQFKSYSITDQEALQGINQIPVSQWKYKPGKNRHDPDDTSTKIGPMAQDVNREFGDDVAKDGKEIDLISMNGITMKAIQELTAVVSGMQSNGGNYDLIHKALGVGVPNKLAKSDHTAIDYLHLIAENTFNTNDTLLNKKLIISVPELDFVNITAAIKQSGMSMVNHGKDMMQPLLKTGNMYLDTVQSLLMQGISDGFDLGKAGLKGGKKLLWDAPTTWLKDYYNRHESEIKDRAAWLFNKTLDFGAKALDFTYKTITDTIPSVISKSYQFLKNLKEGAKRIINPPRDVYIQGASRPSLFAEKMRNGFYVDVEGKPIRGIDDLLNSKGNIYDASYDPAEVALLDTDRANGLYDIEGNKLLTVGGIAMGIAGGVGSLMLRSAGGFWKWLSEGESFFTKGKNALSAIKSGLGSFFSSSWISGAFGTDARLLRLTAQVRDLLAIGKSPRLVAHVYNRDLQKHALEGKDFIALAFGKNMARNMRNAKKWGKDTQSGKDARDKRLEAEERRKQAEAEAIDGKIDRKKDIVGGGLLHDLMNHFRAARRDGENFSGTISNALDAFGVKDKDSTLKEIESLKEGVAGSKLVQKAKAIKDYTAANLKMIELRREHAALRNKPDRSDADNKRMNELDTQIDIQRDIAEDIQRNFSGMPSTPEMSREPKPIQEKEGFSFRKLFDFFKINRNPNSPEVRYKRLEALSNPNEEEVKELQALYNQLYADKPQVPQPKKESLLQRILNKLRPKPKEQNSQTPQEPTLTEDTPVAPTRKSIISQKTEKEALEGTMATVGLDAPEEHRSEQEEKGFIRRMIDRLKRTKTVDRVKRVAGSAKRLGMMDMLGKAGRGLASFLFSPGEQQVADSGLGLNPLHKHKEENIADIRDNTTGKPTASDADGDGMRDAGSTNQLKRQARERESLKEEENRKLEDSRRDVEAKLVARQAKNDGLLTKLLSMGISMFGSILSAVPGLFKGVGLVARGAAMLGGAAIAAPVATTVALGKGAAMGAKALFSGGVKAALTRVTLGALATGGVGGAVVGAATTAMAALLTPPGLAALGIAVTGYGLYRGYKYLTRNDLEKYQRIRMLQYGLTGDNNNYHRVKAMEEYALSHVKWLGKKAEPNLRSLDVNKIKEIFDVGDNDTEHAERVMTWLHSRFYPFFTKQLEAVVNSSEKAHKFNISDLKPDERLRYLNEASILSGPYDVTTSPFKDTPSLPNTLDETKALVESYKLEDEKKVKELPKSKTPISNEINKSIEQQRDERNKLEEKRIKEDKREEERSVLDKARADGLTIRESIMGQKTKTVTGTLMESAKDVPQEQSAIPTPTSMIESMRANSRQTQVKAGPLPDPMLAALNKDQVSDDGGKAPITIGSGDKGRVKTGAGSLPIKKGPIVDPAAGKGLVTAEDQSSITNLNKEVSDALHSMAAEYNLATGKTLKVNGGYRSTAEQARLYQSLPKGRAAKPGWSMHEFGAAIDMDRGVVNQLEKMGLMRKHGFTRPVAGEPWHMEPAGIQGSLSKVRASQAFLSNSMLASYGRGGGGIGTLNDGRRKYTRDDAYAKSLYELAGDSEVSETQTDTHTGIGLKAPKQPQESTKALSGTNIGAGPLNSPGASDTPLPIPKSLRVQGESGEQGDGKEPKPKPSQKESFNDLVAKHAEEAGQDPRLMQILAGLESSGGKNTKPHMGSAKGPYQFMPATWKEQMGKHGDKYGLSGNESPDDLRASVLLTSEYYKGNSKSVKDVRGDKFDIVDAYFAHKLGRGGATKFARMRDEEVAAGSFPKEAEYNRNVFFDKSGRPLTVGEIRQAQREKIKRISDDYDIDLGDLESTLRSGSAPSSKSRSDTRPSTPLAPVPTTVADRAKPDTSEEAIIAQDVTRVKKEAQLRESVKTPPMVSKPSVRPNQESLSGMKNLIQAQKDTTDRLLRVTEDRVAPTLERMDNTLRSLYDAFKAKSNAPMEAPRQREVTASSNLDRQRAYGS